ncbi:MAG: TraB/GumN family protein, partial [Syntrophorhabdaceae bacterium]|nr:TraB/GumN family protein [Syntrophorhabdaceae bacterium]
MRNPFRKEFRMLWKVEKNKKISYLAGCAHFFPVSYRSSFKTIIRELNPVMFEGPLDEGNMDAVRGLGVVSRNTKSIKEFIDREIQKAIEREISSFYYKEYFKDFIGILKQGKASLFESETDGLSPWMAFFRIWTIFLKNRGWHYSVDLDAHTVAKELGKTVIYLETVEEQIAALEGIPVERIIRFISHF